MIAHKSHNFPLLFMPTRDGGNQEVGSKFPVPAYLEAEGGTAQDDGAGCRAWERKGHFPQPTSHYKKLKPAK